MDDIIFTDDNTSKFKDSLLKSLNSDLKDLDNKINFELLEAYINNVFSKNIDLLNLDEILLDPLVVKLSKKDSLYNKYLSNILNISYVEYLNKIKELIKNKKKVNLIINYALSNLDILDYKNNIELEISSIYANLILKDCLEADLDQRWFISYIIKKEALNHGFKPNVIGFNIVNKKKIVLFKISNYKSYKDINILDPYSNNIYINLGLFKLIKKDKGNTAALFYLLNSCFKELQLFIRRSNIYKELYDDTMYRFIKESIIFKEDNSFYNKNKIYFSSRINLNEETNNMTKSLMENPLFSNFDFIKELNDNAYLSNKNTKDYLEVDNHIDNILLNKNEILKTYPLLQMEYTKEGKRKSIKELIDIKKEKLDYFNNQIENYKNILNETDNDIIKDNISIKLNELENGILGINRCHNNMIYKALRVFNILDFTKYLEKSNTIIIEELKEVIKQEKDDIIKKLENNRSKIFKPTTFLKNEEFLTKEYSKVAGYESKISDFEKKKS